VLEDRALARILSPDALTGPRTTDVALRRRVQRTPAYQRLRARLAQE
jgi:hypothetical protein